MPEGRLNLRGSSVHRFTEQALDLRQRTHAPGGSQAHPMRRNSPAPAVMDKKMAKVMGEYHAGSLRSSSGRKVTKRKQAVAIGMSEARRAGRGR